jgi:hypothetical protein
MSWKESFFIAYPHAAELYERAVLSPELVRVEGDVARVGGGSYDRARVLKAVSRFVVEPVAIAAAAERGEGSWFRVYGPEVRAGVAERLVRVVEREGGINVS